MAAGGRPHRSGGCALHLPASAAMEQTALKYAVSRMIRLTSRSLSKPICTPGLEPSGPGGGVCLSTSKALEGSFCLQTAVRPSQSFSGREGAMGLSYEPDSTPRLDIAARHQHPLQPE